MALNPNIAICEQLMAEHLELVEQVTDAARDLNAVNAAYLAKIDSLYTTVEE